ncbi:MAG: hypothetical protein CSA74_05005 [Rhodobacterales bacterium]|nr:MAG: hypothetical protein CSA74_05005 [Rhodobacterales bacterium]
MNRIIGSFSRKTIAAALAGAMAMTAATAQPASAKEDKTTEAIVAATVFGLMAAAIIASKHRDKHSTPSASPSFPQFPSRPGRLPGECRFEVTDGPNRGSWYGHECLVAAYNDWPTLPERCEHWVQLPRWRQDVLAYNAQCLAQSGFLQR